MRIYRIGNQILGATNRLVLLVHLITRKIKQTHSYFADVHGQLPFLELSRVEIYDRGIIGAKRYFVIVLSKLNGIVRHWRNLAIAPDHSVLLVGALVAGGAREVQWLWLLGWLISHDGLVNDYLAGVLRLVNVTRGQVKVNLGVSDLGTIVCLGWGRCLHL